MFRSVRLAKLVCVVASCCPLSMVVAAPVATPTWSYRVAKGDSLYSVARTYLAPGVSWQKLQRFNRVANPKHLTPGRELRLPVAWLRAEATVAFIRGQAQRDNDGAVLKAGDTLRAGDLLVTEADASVTLQLADASRVLVAGGSRVRMESLLSFGRSGVISSRLGLEKGRGRFTCQPGRRARHTL